MATIWRGGCIIRAKFLNRIKEAYDDDAGPAVADRGAVLPQRDRVRHRRLASCRGDRDATGYPDPRVLLGAVLLRRAAHRRLPAALTQGLRDFFGAHTYGRIDEDPGKNSTPCGVETARKCRSDQGAASCVAG